MGATGAIGDAARSHAADVADKLAQGLSESDPDWQALVEWADELARLVRALATGR
jgi:hypothetical protein